MFRLEFRIILMITAIQGGERKALPPRFGYMR